MHDIILIWVLSWIALFAAVVYWPHKSLLPDVKHWNPKADDLNRIAAHADKARAERKDLDIPDKFIRIL